LSAYFRWRHSRSLNEKAVAATRIFPADLVIMLHEIAGKNTSFGIGLAQRAQVATHAAAHVGVTALSAYFWKMGLTAPRADNLHALCKVLKLPIRVARQIAGG
jgi:hypothetical protein